ncbi:putative EF-hand domain pair protein CML [Helianthus annuus]|uniref:EF-hand domain pair protein CML n=1 Tax=Helianthus annuus TaxID=4232 RepID=A0A251TJY8_HELAN|nr:probable calcium-binding protein CML36 [Helianthus annuus]KAF5785994.1 putative EF-hand domain pair protein CML [Helianthus annuus]KAJ0513459.1 putative EF-hand domain-containing protein [Helianthus annuus]KAJ0521316.1 putative EF-hand domain pair protein CML [Helianthus annuus]KAJ0529575.1 putative EF-hand domain-containing protein [Helianthus annuus]KAJ0696459.1 putative EF-hand domain-containing protein [Helianthus annuus]
MKIAGKIHPKHLFRSKKNRSVSRSDPPSFNSYATTSSGSPEPSHRNDKSTLNGVATPTSVLPSHEICSDEWSEVSTDVQVELIQAFRFIDADNDGQITLEELEAVLSRIGGSEPLIREELSLMLNELDKNGDGIITLDEFGAISSAFGPPACDTELRDVFDFFDGDHDGRITADELFEALKSLGDGKCTLEECKSMISNVDKNGDGFVCFEDFSRMMAPQI